MKINAMGLHIAGSAFYCSHTVSEGQAWKEPGKENKHAQNINILKQTRLLGDHVE